MRWETEEVECKETEARQPWPNRVLVVTVASFPFPFVLCVRERERKSEHSTRANVFKKVFERCSLK